ncbi:MAG: TRAP transporter small permease subunit [Polyangiales bacterium]
MIVVAASQALLRNLTNLEIGWANTALSHMEWADSFLQKGTLWLAFFGASLATHDEKHIAIDVAATQCSRHDRHDANAAVCRRIILFILRVFWMVAFNNAKETPLEFSVLDGASGMLHICDAAPSVAIAAADMVRPEVFCAIRSFLSVFGRRCRRLTSCCS